MPLYIAKSGDLDRCYRCLPDSQRKDRATQLLIKYKSGALVTQLVKALTPEQRDIDELPNRIVLLALFRISPFVDFPPRSFHCFFCPFKVLQM